MKPPIQTSEIFYGGTASLILAGTSTAVLYDIQQGKKIAEISTPSVKYVVWSADGSLVALLSKHSKSKSYSHFMTSFVNTCSSNNDCE